MLFTLYPSCGQAGFSAARVRSDFQTLDGQLVCYEEGAEALRCGAAVLVGGLLVVSGLASLRPLSAHPTP